MSREYIYKFFYTIMYYFKFSRALKKYYRSDCDQVFFCQNI